MTNEEFNHACHLNDAFYIDVLTWGATSFPRNQYRDWMVNLEANRTIDECVRHDKVRKFNGKVRFFLEKLKS